MKNQYSMLEQSILATCIYHDSLGIALSVFDVWKYCVRLSGMTHPSLFDIDQALHGEVLSTILVQRNGFWSFRDRENILVESEQRRIETVRKRRALARIGRVFRYIPFIEGVVVSGSLAYGNAHKGSDYDILVVATHGHVWMVRMMCSVVLQLLGKRRHGMYVADRVCLNHFVSDEALTIKYESIYNAQTYVRWLPLYSSKCFQTLLHENAWISRYMTIQEVFTSYYRWCVSPAEGIMSVGVRITEKICSQSLGRFVERVCERVQRFYIGVHQRQVESGRVVLSDSELEFHPGSIERTVIERCNAKFLELGIQYSWSDSGIQ